MTSNNRQKFNTLLLAVVILLTNLSGCSVSQSEKISESAFVLNTVATITIYGSTDETLLDDAFALCRKYDALLSRTDKNSEIYKLNTREISTVSDETAALIAEGLYYGTLSGGAFDITIEPLAVLWNFTGDDPVVPTAADVAAAREKVDYSAVSISGNTVQFANDSVRLDLGGIAKGYIADRVKEYLVSKGVTSAIINLGGNVLCIGGKTDTKSFKIGIQYPFKEGSIASVTVSGLSVVTSGIYERYFEENGKLYHHLLDPKTGYPADNGLLSVTIIGANSSVCDALSTACFVLGVEKGSALVEEFDGYYAIYLTDDYTFRFSAGAQDALDIDY